MTAICPKCQAEYLDDSAIAGMIHCAPCDAWFEVPKQIEEEITPEPEMALEQPQSPAQVEPELIAEQKAELEAKRKLDDLRERIEIIHLQANTFIVIAIICGVVGLILLLCAIPNNSISDSSSSFLIAGLYLIGTAISFYLVAQIVYIRANTEK